MPKLGVPEMAKTAPHAENIKSHRVRPAGHEAQNGREYFLNLRQKNVSHIRLYLTDEHNNLLPLFAGQNAHKGTARFTCTLRFDIIQVRMPNEFETPPYNPGIPPRFTSNFLEKLDFGAPEKTFR